ncbi:MAG TPA: hypothetical protein VN226_01715 [Anaerolineales bacterium]|nr:hypothetical protein [Anaerolineales bacterium]
MPTHKTHQTKHSKNLTLPKILFLVGITLIIIVIIIVKNQSSQQASSSGGQNHIGALLGKRLGNGESQSFA